ncbi:unnamed protein product [Closterium sp. NIES-64]|nr:unnamed protein product [Closterium sp. NIES-64]CAI5994484.1 unnamed protein product [Closterium sp. NIES-64]
MATLRSAFILALVLASLPALYAASAPLRGDVAAGGSAAVDAAARWGRKLLEASSGSVASGADAELDQQGGEEEEEVGEVTDGLDEAVRVLLTWGEMKNAAAAGTSTNAGSAGGKIGDIVSKAVAAKAQVVGLGICLLKALIKSWKTPHRAAQPAAMMDLAGGGLLDWGEGRHVTPDP